MFDIHWIETSVTSVVMVSITVLGTYLALMVLTRLGGLRSFSKQSSFDFALTVAIGSIVASAVVAKSPPLVQAAAALAGVFGVKLGVGALRKRLGWVESLVDNQPVLIMAGNEMLHENMRRVQMTEADLRAKLREANVLDWREIRAVVMESTGDVSVLHGDPEGRALDPDLLEGVRGVERLRDS